MSERAIKKEGNGSGGLKNWPNDRMGEQYRIVIIITIRINIYFSWFGKSCLSVWSSSNKILIFFNTTKTKATIASQSVNNICVVYGPTFISLVESIDNFIEMI